MLRTPTSFSPTSAAAVRRHFALTQIELGRWLDVSVAMVASAEAGRRQFSPAAAARLGRLSSLLPPHGSALPAPADLVPPPLAVAAWQLRDAADARRLRLRARRCQHLAARLAFEMDTWALQDAALLRRRQGRAALHTALAAPPAYFDPLANPAFEADWLARLEGDTAAGPPRPGPLARARAALRLGLLREEAEALTLLLAG